MPLTPEDGAPLGPQAALDRALVHGIAWTGAARWFTQVLSWASTLIVARLLTPADFGLMGMATVYLGLVQMVNEFGIGAALVQVRDLDDESRAALGGLAVALGVVFFGLSAALAVPIATFFHEPAVRDIIIVLAATFVITGLRVLPYALLSRDLEFRRLARIDGAEALLQTAATLVLAIAGYRYWSLVLGSVIAALASTSLSLAARPHRLAWPRTLKPLLGSVTLGWHVTVSRVAWYAYSNADFLIVGRVLGKAALGAYTFGWQIASVPVDKVSAVLGRVTLPVFAKVQDDLAELSRYVRGLSEVLALVTFPLSFGMALVADHFVLLVLGEHWRAAIGPLRLLSLYAGIRSLTTIFPQVLIAIGRAAWTMWVSIILAAVLPVAFYVGTHWGTNGVALAWIIVYPIIAIPLMVLYTLKRIGLRAADYLRALWPATQATALMAAAVLVTDRFTPASWSHAVALAAHVAVGATAYGLTVWFVHADRLRRFRAVLTAMRD